MLKGWHFVGVTLRDGSPVPRDGVWLEHFGPIKMCQRGFHFSLHPYDALIYAPGHILCQVEVDGYIIQEQDKGVASKRMIVKRLNFEDQLFFFARQQALKVIDKWEAPEVVKQFLRTGNKNLRSAAWSAVESAARSAVWSAVESAAWSSAAWSAAWSAAESAARSAAWSAAWSAAESAARSSAWSAAREEFLQLVEKEFQS